MYLIHGFKGENMYPCMYALLQRKTRKIYIEMLQQLKRIADDIGLDLRCKKAGVDFEDAAHKAFDYVWPGVDISGCYFHFRQANCRWLFLHGYKKQYHANIEFKAWCRKVGALALIPIENIAEAWALLKNSKPIR